MNKLVRRVEDERGHHYEKVSDGKWLAGVTSVTGLLPKDWMPAWGALEAVSALGYYREGTDAEKKNLEDQLALIQGCDADTYYKILHEAKSAFRKKSDKAKDIGTEGHEWLERYVLAKISKKPTPSIISAPEKLRPMIKAFVDWEQDKVKEWFASEALVAHIGFEYAGTLDGLALTNEGLTIIDFKFADNTSKSWKLQTAAYAKAFEPFGVEIKDRIIFQMPKSQFKLKWDRGYKKVANKVKAITLPQDELEFDFKTFIHLREVYRWTNYNEKN